MNQQLPETLTVQAQAVVERAKALGLIWTMRPAAVDMASATAPKVIYDGDTLPVGAVSLIGMVLPTDRVMMIQVPPAGNFVIGRLPDASQSPFITPTFRGETRSTGDVTLTTASQAVTPVTSLTLASAGEFLITGIADLDQTLSAGNNLGTARLEVDGAVQAEEILFAVTATGQRASVAQTWYGTLTAGTHTFGLVANKNLNIGTFISRFPHTGFTYQIWQ